MEKLHSLIWYVNYLQKYLWKVYSTHVLDSFVTEWYQVDERFSFYSRICLKIYFDILRVSLVLPWHYPKEVLGPDRRNSMPSIETISKDLKRFMCITNYEIPIEFFLLQKLYSKFSNSSWFFAYHEIRLYDEMNAC